MADTTPPIDTYADATETAPPPPRRHPLVRSRDSRLIAGVADGLAAAWGWRTWLVRLGFIVATAFAGLGIVLYAAGWLLIPQEGQPESVAQRMVRSMNIQRAWVGFGLLLAGGLIVGQVANIDGSILIAGTLLVTGYALYTGAFALPAVQPQPDSESSPLPPSVYQRVARPPRPKSYLGRLTLGAMLVTLGIMGAVDAAGAARPTSRHYAAAALLVIGVGLLVGFMFGRSRGLVVLGLLLLPVVAVAAIADYRFGTAWEYLTITPDSPAELQSAYRIGSGDITVDLTQLDLGAETITLDLEVGVGNITVRVPPDVAIEATGNAIVGNVRVGGVRSGGLGAEVIRSTDGDGGRLVVDADVRIGSIDIVRNDLTGFEAPVITAVPGDIAPLISSDRIYQIAGGTSFEAPRRVAEVAGLYEIVDGRLILDLTRIDQPNAVVRIDFVGSGEALLIIPPEARVIATEDIPDSDFGGTPEDGVSAWEIPGDGITFVINASGPAIRIEEG